MEENSSFFAMPGTPVDEAPVSVVQVHSSSVGSCDIYRIDRMGRFRALKCLKPSFRGNPTYELLLKKEFEIGYMLDHAHICEYYSMGRSASLGNCIEMEWIDGRTLEEVLSKEKPRKEDLVRMVGELCDALSYLHSKQVFHRDLKPSNILITYKGDSVKLIDFGFSDSDSHSQLKTPAGTRTYAAPEVLGGGEADARSDIFSLGVILSSLPGGHFRKVARKCCKTNPSERYGSVQEVKEALGQKPIHPLAGLSVAAALLLVLFFPRLSGFRQPALQPDAVSVPESSEVQAVTVAAPVPVDTLKETPSVPITPPSGEHRPRAAAEPEPASADPAAIDELFRQATELFD